MQSLILFLCCLSASPEVFGDTGGNNGASSNGQATNGQVDLNIQQSSALDNGNQLSLGNSQSSLSGTSISFNNNINGGLQFDPTLPVNPYISGSNSANSYGSGTTGVLQNNHQSYSNSTNDGQHHSVVSQSHITGNGTGLSLNNYVSGAISASNSTDRPQYYTTMYYYPCPGCSPPPCCPSPGPPYFSATESPMSAHSDQRQRKIAPRARTRNQQLKGRGQAKVHEKSPVRTNPTTAQRKVRSKL
ncbi:uncharacterized protein LOC129599137 [Paramacrobiotus metropolitanus]|uniref:uncharacterized protein LOC129599137 n=1 Tax=Paramacrobiotus metropolitanus TaxID=2943436 RepID=UPI0024456765|nr:uncharacterized protein LOC129599137 [Paramacrobiotus metropolitanus]